MNPDNEPSPPPNSFWKDWAAPIALFFLPEISAVIISAAFVAPETKSFINGVPTLFGPSEHTATLGWIALNIAVSLRTSHLLFRGHFFTGIAMLLFAGFLFFAHVFMSFLARGMFGLLG